MVSINELSPLERVETGMNILDKLADAQGRAKCGYVYILSELLENLHNDVLIMEEKLKDYEKPKEANTEVEANQNGVEN